VKKCGTVQLALQAKCKVICHRAYKVRKPVKKEEKLFFIHFSILFFPLAFPNYSRIVVSNEAFFASPVYDYFFFLKTPRFVIVAAAW
jgi:hypothetical protein